MLSGLRVNPLNRKGSKMDELFNRIVAEINAEQNGLYVNCEECGVEIPVEYARCVACEEVKYPRYVVGESETLIP